MSSSESLAVAHAECSENIVPTLLFGSFDLAAAIRMTAERMAIDIASHRLRNTASDVVRLVVAALQTAQGVLWNGHDQIDLVEAFGACEDQSQPLAQKDGCAPRTAKFNCVDKESKTALLDIEKERSGMYDGHQTPQSLLHCILLTSLEIRKRHIAAAHIANEFFARMHLLAADGTDARKEERKKVARGALQALFQVIEDRHRRRY